MAPRRPCTPTPTLAIVEPNNVSPSVSKFVSSSFSSPTEGSLLSKKSPTEGSLLSKKSPTEGSDLSSFKNVRGKNQGLGLNKYYRRNGKIKIYIPEGKNRPVGPHCEKLSREIGRVVRQFAPLMVTGWTKISDETKAAINNRVKEKLDLQWDLPHVIKCVDEIAQDCYKNFRCRLHKAFKDAGGGDAARRTPPKDLIDRTEEWNWLCDYFLSENFQIRMKAGANNRSKQKFVHRRGSQTFVAAQEKLGCDQVELYKHTYCGSNGWVHEEAKARYEQMVALQSKPIVERDNTLTDDQLCREVLGTRFGYEPQCVSDAELPRDCNDTSQGGYANLQDELERTKKELDTMKISLDTTKQKLVATEEKLDNAMNQIRCQDKKIDWLIQQLMPGLQPPDLSSL